ncbi:hypothetical protein J6590_011150 [Homalodisca vitripennis]|nr:hypothetical protein J6590_011150 [Homalodisca vitripennis]
MFCLKSLKPMYKQWTPPNTWPCSQVMTERYQFPMGTAGKPETQSPWGCDILLLPALFAKLITDY